LGPFVEKTNLIAWLEEMVLRLGPSTVMYANQFPDADPKLIRLLQEFGAELIQGFKKPRTVGPTYAVGRPPPTGGTHRRGTGAFAPAAKQRRVEG
jgi:hypothetical protein